MTVFSTSNHYERVYLKYCRPDKQAITTGSFSWALWSIFWEYCSQNIKLLCHTVEKSFSRWLEMVTQKYTFYRLIDEQIAGLKCGHILVYQWIIKQTRLYLLWKKFVCVKRKAKRFSFVLILTTQFVFFYIFYSYFMFKYIFFLNKCVFIRINLCWFTKSTLNREQRCFACMCVRERVQDDLGLP